MILNNLIIGSNPFIDAYVHSDLLGKGIFLGLLVLSVLSWIVIIYEVRLLSRSKKQARLFREQCDQRRHAPLSIEVASPSKSNPFLRLYLSLKRQTLDLLNKNRHFIEEQTGKTCQSYLAQADINLVGDHLMTEIACETKNFEKHLYLLNIVVTLAPFLGLLGTAWGILMMFSDYQVQGGALSNQGVLSGIALALASTVIGLIDAIPAVVGYYYLRSSVRDFETEMESFTNNLLIAVELQYRQVDIRNHAS